MAGISEFLDLDLGWTSGDNSDGSIEFVKALGSSPADKTVTIVGWRIKPGDIVSTGDIIADVESDKAIAELACPTSGTVEAILVVAGNSVPVGTNILRIRPAKPGERLTPTIMLQRAAGGQAQGKGAAFDCNGKNRPPLKRVAPVRSLECLPWQPRKVPSW